MYSWEVLTAVEKIECSLFCQGLAAKLRVRLSKCEKWFSRAMTYFFGLWEISDALGGVKILWSTRRSQILRRNFWTSSLIARARIFEANVCVTLVRLLDAPMIR